MYVIHSFYVPMVSSIRTARTLDEVRECLEEQIEPNYRGRVPSLREWIDWSGMRVYESTPGAGNRPRLIPRERLIEMLGL